MKRYSLLLILITAFALCWVVNQMPPEDPKNIVFLDADHRLSVQIDNASTDAIKQITEIIRSRELNRLIGEVTTAYQKDQLILLMVDNLEFHGAFDPDSEIPKVLLNSKTGISESNLAHELVHAIQIRQGYPTVPRMFKDRRKDVLRELSSNIMHIPLTDVMSRSGFSVENYLRPTLDSISSILAARNTKDETQMSFIRAHYEASVYLRLHYEAQFLSGKERRVFESLFNSKAPIAETLGKELIALIDKHDINTPRGATIALYECVEFFNNKDLSKHYSDHVQNTYSPFTAYLKKQYPFCNSL